MAKPEGTPDVEIGGTAKVSVKGVEVWRYGVFSVTVRFAALVAALAHSGSWPSEAEMQLKCSNGAAQ